MMILFIYFHSLLLVFDSNVYHRGQKVTGEEKQNEFTREKKDGKKELKLKGCC